MFWTEEALVEKLQEAASVLGHPPSCRDIDSMLGYPSHNTIRKRLGKWNEALQRAGLYVRRSTVCSEIRQMSTEEAAYVAGILDGEGHIRVHQAKKRGCASLKCEIANTDLELLYHIQNLTNGGTIQLMNPARGNNRVPAYKLRYLVGETIQLLPQLLPYLVVKYDEVKSCMSWLAMRRIH